ncbi:MAG TPA: hypothetical protein VFI08_14165 [Spirochaetia bacterium]|nr:hypothetical protein [Spirochaetia bacterium]
MGELKSCLFCGKRVDRAFEYCPHCGYEFGDEEERLSVAGAERLLFGDRPADMPRDLSPRGADLPVLVEEDAGDGAPPADQDYLHRLRNLQDILSDMERELDRLLATDGQAGLGEPGVAPRPRNPRSVSAGP